eukprot:SAG31_NODE_45401_length_259_cov_0.637500_1_plen_56_part_01
MKTYAKAVLALYGAIVFWYGAWTQFDVGFTQLGFSWASGVMDGSDSTHPICAGDGA